MITILSIAAAVLALAALIVAALVFIGATPFSEFKKMRDAVRDMQAYSRPTLRDVAAMCPEPYRAYVVDENGKLEFAYNTHAAYGPKRESISHRELLDILLDGDEIAITVINNKRVLQRIAGDTLNDDIKAHMEARKV